MKNLIFLTLISITLFSCKKDSELNITFKHEVNGSGVDMNQNIHFNQVGQTFGITKLQYYVSEITFIGDNDNYTIAGAKLIDLSDPNSLSFDGIVLR